jgi:hypothetical protein
MNQVRYPGSDGRGISSSLPARHCKLQNAGVARYVGWVSAQLFRSSTKSCGSWGALLQPGGVEAQVVEPHLMTAAAAWAPSYST